MSKRPLVLGFQIVLTLFAVDAAFCEAPHMPCDELRRLQLLKEDLALVDVRPPADFAKAHIQGAKNIPAAGIDSGGLARGKRLVVYCSEHPCVLSNAAAETLIASGYSDVSVLEGGLAEWLKRGYPVVSDDEAAANKPRPGRIAADAARRRAKAGELEIVDVRPAVEFSAGHLPGARNIPLEDLKTLLARLPKETDILVYDRAAARSRKAAEMLLEAGYKVSELSGGLAGWVSRKYPLEVK